MAPLFNAVATLATVIKLQEQLLAREGELDSWESTLMAQEDDLVASEHAPGRARMECDAECDQNEAVR
jgi:hypothetical protein